MAYRDYSTAHGHIVDASGQGDFTSISAALAAAVSGETIFLRPGTYSSATLVPGVNITSFGCEGLDGNVIINGDLNLSSAGTVCISGVTFNCTSNVLTVSGAGVSILNVENCYFNIATSTPISFTNSNAASELNVRNCSGDTGSNTVAIYAISGAGSINFYDCDFFNSGLTTAANSCSSGSVTFKRGTCNIQSQFTGSGQGLFMDVEIDTSSVNVSAIISNGSNVTAFGCLLSTGTADAAQVNAGLVLAECYIGCIGANAITGTGTIFYTDLMFGGTNTITVLTQTPQNWQPYSTAGSSGSAVRGTAAFDSTYFTDVNGFVSLVSSPGTSWVTTSANIANMAIGTGYFCISPGGALTLGLPAVSALGDTIRVSLAGATSWQITQAAGQQILVSTATSTLGAGGSVSSNAQGDSIELVCLTANTVWVAQDVIGNLTIV